MHSKILSLCGDQNLRREQSSCRHNGNRKFETIYRKLSLNETEIIEGFILAIGILTLNLYPSTLARYSSVSCFACARSTLEAFRYRIRHCLQSSSSRTLITKRLHASCLWGEAVQACIERTEGRTYRAGGFVLCTSGVDISGNP